MNRAIVTITSDETALTAAQRMTDKHIGALFVMEAEELVGIVTEADLVRKLLASQLDPEKMRVGALMNSPLLDIDINRTIRDASDLMAVKRVRHLAVSEHEKVSACCRSETWLKWCRSATGRIFCGAADIRRRGAGRYLSGPCASDIAPHRFSPRFDCAGSRNSRLCPRPSMPHTLA